jgi:hypothetical protein
MDDARRLAAEAVYNAILQAQRDAGDPAVADAFDRLALQTGQNGLRHAASVFRGGVGLGRKAIDDTASLRRILACPPEKRRERVGIEAQRLAGPGASKQVVHKHAQRLREKLRKLNAGNCSLHRIASIKTPS